MAVDFLWQISKVNIPFIRLYGLEIEIFFHQSIAKRLTQGISPCESLGDSRDFHRCNGEITWKAVTVTTAPLESTILGPLHIKMHTLRLEGYKHCKVNGLLVWNCLAPPILHESTLISRETLNVDHNCFSRITTKQWCLLGTRKFSGIGNSWTLIRGE